ncbi:hypothetical protein E4T56_gene4000 [Termitomyces sp. T112]|nr:hypothetical protein E4T56_gene4000 [Termitomyces sp. T112]
MRKNNQDCRLSLRRTQITSRRICLFMDAGIGGDIISRASFFVHSPPLLFREIPFVNEISDSPSRRDLVQHNHT